MFISFVLILNPIAEILGFISFLGTIASTGITLFSFLASVLLSSGVILIAVLVNRPLYLIAIIGVILILLVCFKK